MTDLIHAFTLPQLVDLALAPLARATGLDGVAKPAVAAPTQAPASPALAVAHA